MVTADLPAFSRQGDKIKVKVSTIGDAKSIDNGELLITQLKGVDGNVYALAQGTIVANEVNKTTGFIYDGATVENEIEFDFQSEKSIQLSLFKSSATNADLIETKINQKFGQKLASAIDTRTIEVQRPSNVPIVKFIATIQNIELDSTFKKKLIIDMNRESVITGGDVVIDPVTIARGSFTIRISKTPLSSQEWDDMKKNPGVNIGDDVKIADKAIVNIDNAMINTKSNLTVSDLVRSMKVMKLPMSEIIDTLKLIKEMGAIDAEIEVRG